MLNNLEILTNIFAYFPARVLQLNDNFVPPLHWIQTRRCVKTDFRQKRPFMNRSGKFQWVNRPKFWCRHRCRFNFSCRWSESSHFGRFSVSQGPKWSAHFLYATQKAKRTEATGRKSKAGPSINESGKLQGVKRLPFQWLRSCEFSFSRRWPQKGPFPYYVLWPLGALEGTPGILGTSKEPILA